MLSDARQRALRSMMFLGLLQRKGKRHLITKRGEGVKWG